MYKNNAALKLEIVKNGLELGESFKVWSKLVEKEWSPSILTEDEEIRKDVARLNMMENQLPFIEELIELEYLEIKNGTDDTYVKGRNCEDVFLMAVSEIFTEERGYITESENDYYETARAMYELVTPNYKM